MNRIDEALVERVATRRAAWSVERFLSEMQGRLDLLREDLVAIKEAAALTRKDTP